MDLDLRDKTAFVTGASGGIGHALIEAFLEEGARVIAHSRRGVEEEPPNLVSLRGDVRDRANLSAAMNRAVRAYGRIDVCVANAGIWPEEDVDLDLMADTRIREVIDTNLLGALWTARAFFEVLRETGPRPDTGASLVFIGSTAGRFGEAGHAEYAASKAALVGLVRTLKNEIVHVDARGRVNLVEPGWTVTPMAEEALRAEGAVDRITSTRPLRTLATPEDVANAVLFFASPVMSRHVTGESLLVAGGMEGRLLW